MPLQFLHQLLALPIADVQYQCGTFQSGVPGRGQGGQEKVTIVCEISSIFSQLLPVLRAVSGVLPVTGQASVQ